MEILEYMMLPLLVAGSSAEFKRPPIFDGLYSYEKAMLVGGIFVLLVLVGLLVYCVVTKQPYGKLLLSLVVPIPFIGFPSLQKIGFNLESDKLEVESRKLQENANDPTAKTALAETIRKVESRPTADPRVLLRLAQANKTLGRGREAVVHLNRALRIQPNLLSKALQIEPNLPGSARIQPKPQKP